MKTRKKRKLNLAAEWWIRWRKGGGGVGLKGRVGCGEANREERMGKES